MKKQFLILPLLLAGCASAAMGSSRNEKHQTEMAVHKARTDVQELKFELNSALSKLEILENKLNNQDSLLTTIKQEVLSAHEAQLEELSIALSTLEKKCKQTHKHQEKTLEHFKDLSLTADKTKTALTQYKNKIAEIEHQLVSQEEKIQEIAKLQQLIETTSLAPDQLMAQTQEDQDESKETHSTD